MKWASDQTEIVVTGDLPSVEDWDGIARSLDCSNPKKDWSFQNVLVKNDLTDTFRGKTPLYAPDIIKNQTRRS